jgi:subtilisin-like proprotein convertase family protein
MRHVDTEAHNVPGYPSNDILEIWAFDVDFTTPANSSFTKIADILTAEFDSTLCGLTSFYCMGMPGVSQGSTSSLDPLREVIMHRLGYRNFGTHQSLVGNFVTDIGSNIGGIRWFELRKTGAGAWTLYQEGTYAPTTSDNRWMGGIAQDGSGNIALGYNVSSQTIYPSIRYAGRLASDPLGTLPQGEYTLVNGSGVNGSNRYGDYSAMAIDPIDDCTFWFTGQWNAASQWSTRIGAFRFDACGTTNFTLNVTPDSQQICLPADATYSVATAAVGGFTGNVSLSAAGNPGTATFTPNPVGAPGNSSLVISGAAVGAYSFDVIGTSVITPTLVQSKTVGLEVVAAAPGQPTLLTPANGATSVSTTPTFTWNAVASATSYSIQVATDMAFTNIVASASGLATPTWTSNVTLSPSTDYYWRVLAGNACGTGVYSSAFSFTTAAIVCNTASISIPDSGAATPYPSSISVTGQGISLSDVNVHLVGLSHTYPDDLDILVVGPQGQNLIILSDAGGGTDVVNATVIFDDAAAGPVPDSGPLVSGTYRPTNIGTGDTFPAPAPAPSGATTLTTFNGTDPNGTWSLFVVDDAGGDTGSMAGGWCLELATAPPTAVTLSSMDAAARQAPVAPLAGLPLGALAATMIALGAGYALRRQQ